MIKECKILLKYLLSFFTRVYYTTINGVDFYIRRKPFKRIISMKSIAYYDRSGVYNHIWEYIDFIWYQSEPDFNDFKNFIENQRPSFFDYNIKGYI